MERRPGPRPIAEQNLLDAAAATRSEQLRSEGASVADAQREAQGFRDAWTGTEDFLISAMDQGVSKDNARLFFLHALERTLSTAGVDQHIIDERMDDLDRALHNALETYHPGESSPEDIRAIAKDVNTVFEAVVIKVQNKDVRPRERTLARLQQAFPGNNPQELLKDDDKLLAAFDALLLDNKQKAAQARQPDDITAQAVNTDMPPDEEAPPNLSNHG